jgi:hypothetical protein
MGFKKLYAGIRHNFVQVRQRPEFFPRHENSTFLIMCTKILNFLQQERASLELGIREEEGGVKISDFSCWTETAKDELRTCRKISR